MLKNRKKLITTILKWRYRNVSDKTFLYVISVLIGLLSGLSAVTLRNLTILMQEGVQSNIAARMPSIYFIIPLFGLLLVYGIKKHLLKKKIDHAIPSTLYAISRKNGIIEKYKMYSSLILAPLTAGFGGSVGLLGPAVSTGTSIASNTSIFLHLNAKNRTLLIACAAAAAMASIFKAPIAGVIFAIEIFSLDLAFASLVPILLASIASVLTSYFFLGNGALFHYEISTKFELTDTFFYILLGTGTALASVYFTKMYFWITNAFEQINDPLKRLLIGGLAIGILLYFIPPLYGEGFDLINNLLVDNHLDIITSSPFQNLLDNIWVVIVLLIGITIFKAIAMTTTFAAGGVGGIFIPTLVMGSALGNVMGKIINNIGLNFSVSETNFTLVGMAGLMAGVLHAPLTAIFLIAEITGGYELFIPLMIASSISYLVTKNYIEHNIYTAELAKKGHLLTHDTDKNVLTLMELDSVLETNFKTIQPEMTLNEMLLNAVAKSNRNLFPVIDKEKHFLGILLLDDIRHIMFDDKLTKKTFIRNLMHAAPEVIDYEKDDMKTVMKKFQDSGAWNLPVVKDAVYLGFISKSKMLNAYRNKVIEVTIQ